MITKYVLMLGPSHLKYVRIMFTLWMLSNNLNILLKRCRNPLHYKFFIKDKAALITPLSAAENKS